MMQNGLNRWQSGMRFIGRVVTSRHHPLLAQMVVTRRCNLSCGYCNEYDSTSPPIPLATLLAQIEHLAKLKTVAITCTGGEPLLHPDLPAIINAIRQHGMIVTMISNGFRLSKKRIEALNDAGLQGMQISIDNLVADEVSMKSLHSVESKLKLLAEHANFKVNINSVLGISDERTAEITTIAATAKKYGFYHTVGVLHDQTGQLKPLTPIQFQAYRRVTEISASSAHRLNYWLFQRHLMHGQPNHWKCRAGARYLYICEQGQVHWCSQRRGYPGTPLLGYTLADIKREYNTRKDCSPSCTLGCVHQMSMFDRWRGKQTLLDPGTIQSAQPVAGSGS